MTEKSNEVPTQPLGQMITGNLALEQREESKRIKSKEDDSSCDDKKKEE